MNTKFNPQGLLSFFMMVILGISLLFISNSIPKDNFNTQTKASRPTSDDWELKIRRLPARTVCLENEITYQIFMYNRSALTMTEEPYLLGTGLPTGKYTVTSSNGYVTADGSLGSISWSTDNGVFSVNPREKVSVKVTIIPDKTGTFNSEFESYGGNNLIETDFSNNTFTETVMVDDCKQKAQNNKCAKAGERSVSNVNPTTGEIDPDIKVVNCCSGLVNIADKQEVLIPNICSSTTGVPYNLCAPCGNGVCDTEYEDVCNCPSDCN